jgi:Spy/CpxP family protein refolding chaperone
MKLKKFFVPAMMMLMLVMLPTFALAERGDDFPPDDCPPPPPPHHEGMMDDMMAQLDLTDAQEQLLETMKDAMHAHMKAVHEELADPSPEEFRAMHDKMMNMHRLFGDELKRTTRFPAVA